MSGRPFIKWALGKLSFRRISQPRRNRCKGINSRGAPCKALAINGQDYCIHHHEQGEAAAYGKMRAFLYSLGGLVAGSVGGVASSDLYDFLKEHFGYRNFIPPRRKERPDLLGLDAPLYLGKLTDDPKRTTASFVFGEFRDWLPPELATFSEIRAMIIERRVEIPGTYVHERVYLLNGEGRSPLVIHPLEFLSGNTGVVPTALYVWCIDKWVFLGVVSGGSSDPEVKEFDGHLYLGFFIPTRVPQSNYVQIYRFDAKHHALEDVGLLEESPRNSAYVDL